LLPCGEKQTLKYVTQNLQANLQGGKRLTMQFQEEQPFNQLAVPGYILDRQERA